MKRQNTDQLDPGQRRHKIAGSIDVFGIIVDPGNEGNSHLYVGIILRQQLQVAKNLFVGYAGKFTVFVGVHELEVV